MANLSIDQLAQLAYAAGWRGENLATMVAVAMRESGGNPRAHNPNRATGDNSYGLWQINMIEKLGPARRASFGISSNEQLFDPMTNARAAFILGDQGKSTYHWTGYRAGVGPASYAKWIGPARVAAAKASGKPANVEEMGWLESFALGATIDAGAAVASSGLASPITALGDVVSFVTDPSNWRRVAYVLGAVVLVLMAVGLILSDTVVDVADAVT